MSYLQRLFAGTFVISTFVFVASCATTDAEEPKFSGTVAVASAHPPVSYTHLTLPTIYSV